MTFPFFLVVDSFLVTFPRRQCALRSFARAFLSVSPTTFGTLHLVEFANTALTVWLALIVRAQAPVPEQSPDQPANFDPAPAVAARVTAVPSLS
jgi:hypothetical protein